MIKNLNTRIAAFIVAMVMALCTVIFTVSISKSGVISGVNAETDRKREIQQVEKVKKDTVEGIFVDRNDYQITSYSEPGKAAYVNYPESFSHIIGYNSVRLGTSGLRNKLYTELYSGGNDGIGATIKLTVDATLQEKLYNLLDGFVGSISVINGETGEIMAMVSRGSPDVDYDITLIDEVYSKNEDGVLYYSDVYNKISEFYYNRAVLSQDPPGSCAKIISAICLAMNGMLDLTYVDTGFCLDGTIHNYGYNVYGKCDLQTALMYSVNTYFANAGLTLGGARLRETFEAFMVGETVELDFATLKSTFIDHGGYAPFTVASNAYGQGQLVMAPLHLAMMMSAIMNDGEMMKPYLISNMVDDGKVIYSTDAQVLSVAADKKSCNTIKNMLINNAEHYKLYDYFNKSVKIAAKTGTAQVADQSNGDHIYWAVGVEYEGNTYGICVDRDHTTAGSSSLLPVVVDVINCLINK